MSESDKPPAAPGGRRRGAPLLSIPEDGGDGEGTETRSAFSGARRSGDGSEKGFLGLPPPPNSAQVPALMPGASGQGHNGYQDGHGPADGFGPPGRVKSSGSGQDRNTAHPTRTPSNGHHESRTRSTSRTQSPEDLERLPSGRAHNFGGMEGMGRGGDLGGSYLPDELGWDQDGGWMKTPHAGGAGGGYEEGFTNGSPRNESFLGSQDGMSYDHTSVGNSVSSAAARNRSKEVQSLLEHTARYIQEFDRPPRLLSFTVSVHFLRYIFLPLLSPVIAIFLAKMGLAKPKRHHHGAHGGVHHGAHHAYHHHHDHHDHAHHQHRHH
eukprot:Tamp_15785.p1 GENE.Tamp_15785~~Tamp_15785.p1  ORF type:complete len:323 (-),score=31.58 Tamp_15785:101-1069(-)